MTITPINSQAPFLYTSLVFSEDTSQRLYELTQLVIDTANATNLREISQFALVEIVNGQQFSNATNANVKIFAYRKVFYFGPIAQGTALTTPHGIIGATEYTHIYGTVITDTPDSRPMPYPDVLNVTNQISINITAANYVIAVGATSPNVIRGKLILEYLKN